MKACYLASDPRIKLNAPSGSGSHIRKTILAFEKECIGVFPLIGGETVDISSAKNAYRQFRTIMPRQLRWVGILLRDMYEVFDDFRSFYKYRGMLKRGSIDFIYERAAPFRMVGLKLAQYLKVPLILEQNDPVYETLAFYPSTLRAYALAVERYLIAKATGLVVGSERLKRYYVTIGADPTKIVVIYPTVHYESLDPCQVNEIANSTSSNEGFVCIGFIGTMRPWHRVDLLIEAFREVTAQRPNTRLELIGDGPETEKLRRLVKRFGIESKVVFRGSISHEKVPGYLAGFDICVIPFATWYGSPTKLFEYGAMAKAVVGPRETPVDEIITQDVSGKLVKPGDIGELQRVLTYLCDRKDVRVDLGRNLRNKLMAEITWQKNIHKIVDLMEDTTKPEELG